MRTVRLSKLHNTLRVDAARSDGHILPEVPPPPVGVHHNPQLEGQVDGEKGEDGQVVALLGPHSNADPLQPRAQLDGAKDEADNDELEAECGGPPPAEGEVEVEAGVVVADGGHHRDLEEEEEDEEAQEQAAPVRDAGEEVGGSTQGLQLEIVGEHEDTHQLVTHAEVPVQHVQEAVLVGGVPAHEEEVEGEAGHGDQEEGGGGEEGADIPHSAQQVFSDGPISDSGECLGGEQLSDVRHLDGD